MRPNILIFTPHDLGDHLGCYGHAGVRSPNLDTLAEEGVRFTNTFAVAPECTSSRSGMLTGLHPHQNGLVGLANFGWSIHEKIDHLAAQMRDGGYDTRLIGVQHETHEHPSALGYNHVTPGRHVEDVCADLRSFLQSDEAKGDAPWYCSAGFFDVHRDWRNPSTIPVEEIKVPGYLPDSPAMREEFALFYQNIMEMDAEVGR
ncbi:MAG: sulfatase-like hydrolase/transferase, partial [Planctomycetota bacterium]